MNSLALLFLAFQTHTISIHDHISTTACYGDAYSTTHFHHRHCHYSDNPISNHMDMATQTMQHEDDQSTNEHNQSTTDSLEPKIKIKRIKPSSPMTKLANLITKESGIKIIFFVIQLLCILISLNLCFIVTTFQIPIFLRFLLCTNSGTPLHKMQPMHNKQTNTKQHTALLIMFNATHCINSIFYLDAYDLTFLFSMHRVSLFCIFYILSLRMALSMIINLYLMNIIIWSWVHSRLRGMARLIRDDKSSSGADCVSSAQIPSTLDLENMQRSDWWTWIYCKHKHCYLRRSMLSICLILFALITFAYLIHSMLSSFKHRQQQIDTSVMSNSVYLCYYILPNGIVFILSCVCWIFAIVVENHKTFIMDLCELETVRLLKMMGLSYIIIQCIFIPTMAVSTSASSKTTRNVCLCVFSFLFASIHFAYNTGD